MVHISLGTRYLRFPCTVLISCLNPHHIYFRKWRPWDNKYIKISTRHFFPTGFQHTLIPIHSCLFFLSWRFSRTACDGSSHLQPLLSFLHDRRHHMSSSPLLLEPHTSSAEEPWLDLFQRFNLGRSCYYCTERIIRYKSLIAHPINC